MDSRQLVRKQTKMYAVHHNQEQLVSRWCISEATREFWRSKVIALPPPRDDSLSPKLLDL